MKLTKKFLPDEQGERPVENDIEQVHRGQPTVNGECCGSISPENASTEDVPNGAGAFACCLLPGFAWLPIFASSPFPVPANQER